MNTPLCHGVSVCYPILDLMPLGVVVFDAQYTILLWNKCMEQWTGRSGSEMRGANLLEHYPALDDIKYRSRIDPLFQGGPPTIFSYHVHKHLIPAQLPDGTLRRQHCVASGIRLDPHSQPLAVLTLQDMTEVHHRINEITALREHAEQELEKRKQVECTLLQSQKHLKELASTDDLTGVANRRKVISTLRAELDRSKRTLAPVSLIAFDADHFKRINDTYGHDVGDMALCLLASTLGQQVREIDTVGRLGGEEFAVVLPETALQDALLVAERIRKAVESTPLWHGEERIPLTVSAGVASISAAEDHDGPRTLMKLADDALYLAKRAGRNRVEGPPDQPLPQPS
ncbi:GGDEF domain-containing protein [Megalodesulfovibrio paquesii]